MPPLPVKYVYSCPNPHEYHKAPPSAEFSHCTTGDGVITQHYPFACNGHAQLDYKRKHMEIKRRDFSVKRSWLQDVKMAKEKIRPEWPADSKEREHWEWMAVKYQYKVHERTEQENLELEALRQDLKSQWGLDPKYGVWRMTLPSRNLWKTLGGRRESIVI